MTNVKNGLTIDLNNLRFKYSAVAILNDKLYYVNVIKGIVEPVIQHKFLIFGGN